MKEVGIKKVVGANRKQLIFQFLSESIMLTLLAMVFAVLIVWLLLPQFNQLTGKQISLTPDLKIIGSFFAIALISRLTGRKLSRIIPFKV